MFPRPEGQAPRRPRPRCADRRGQVPRRVRGPPEGGAQRDQEAGGEIICSSTSSTRWSAPAPPKARRCVEHAEAGARPRRAPVHRRDHAGRVPEAHREGQGPRAPLPADLRGGALGRGHDRDPPRTQGRVRGPPQGPDQGLGARGGGRALTPVHRRPLPARQGDRPGGRSGLPAPDRDRLHAAGSTRSSAGSCSSRSSASRWPRRPTSRRGSASAVDRELADLKESSPPSRRGGRARRRPSGASQDTEEIERPGRPWPTPSGAAIEPRGRAAVRHDPRARAAARGGERPPRRAAGPGGSSRRRSTRRTWPRSSRSGPASR